LDETSQKVPSENQIAFCLRGNNSTNLLTKYNIYDPHMSAMSSITLK